MPVLTVVREDHVRRRSALQLLEGLFHARSLVRKESVSKLVRVDRAVSSSDENRGRTASRFKAPLAGSAHDDPADVGVGKDLAQPKRRHTRTDPDVAAVSADHQYLF